MAHVISQNYLTLVPVADPLVTVMTVCSAFLPLPPCLPDVLVVELREPTKETLAEGTDFIVGFAIGLGVTLMGLKVGFVGFLGAFVGNLKGAFVETLMGALMFALTPFLVGVLIGAFVGLLMTALIGRLVGLA